MKLKDVNKFVGVLFLLSSVCSSAQSNFSMIGWQFHDYNIPKLENAIKKAPEYDVNFFIFSHQLFRSVDGFLVSGKDFNPSKKYPNLEKLYSSSEEHTKPHAGWQRDLKYLASLAVKERISYYLWIHEFDDVPAKFKIGRKVNFDDPGLFPYIKKRYEKLLQAMPDCAGFVLTLHESDNKVFRNSEVVSKLDVPERIYRITKLIYDILKEHSKKLILRSFFYEPKEMEYFRKALSKLPDNIIVMSKTTFHEFDPFYPPDSMHGNVGKKKQIIEIDLGVEKAFGSEGAYAQLEYIRRYVRRARKLGLTGMVGRARLIWDKPFDNSHEINLYAFSRFMKDPDLTVDEVAKDWAKKKYNQKAALYIASALLRTQYINHHGRYFLGFWLTKSIGSGWGDYRYYFGHLLERSRYKWTKNPTDKEMENRLYHPDTDTYNKLIAEKGEVINQVKESMKDLDRAGRYVSQGEIGPLKEEFNFLMDAAQLEIEWTAAYFSMRMYMDDPKPIYKMRVENALARLDKMDRTPGVTYGLNKKTGHRYDIDKFILEMRWRMANRNRAREEDKSILKKIYNKMNVDIN